MAGHPAAPCLERKVATDLTLRWALHEQPAGWAQTAPSSSAAASQAVVGAADAAAAAAADAIAAAAVQLVAEGLTVRFERFGAPLVGVAAGEGVGAAPLAVDGGDGPASLELGPPASWRFSVHVGSFEIVDQMASQAGEITSQSE